MMTKEEYQAALEERMEQFRRLNEWEEAHPHRPSPQVALACVSELYDLIPPEERQRPVNVSDFIEFRRLLQILDTVSRRCRSVAR